MDKIMYKGKELLPVKSDIVFKAIFGKEENKDLLASFISSVLDIEVNSEDITITNSELSPIYEEGKLSRLDVRIQCANNTHIDVEIQLRNEYNIEKRSIYYLSQLYTEQLTQGMSYNEIGRTIAINIIDYNLFAFKEYHNKYRMVNVSNKHELTDVFEINFLELKKVEGLDTTDIKDMWLMYLSTNNEEVLDMLVEKNKIFDKAVDQLVHISDNEQLRFEYSQRRKAMHDYNSAMKDTFKSGKLEGKLETARNLKNMNFSIADISKATGLTEDELRKLVFNIESIIMTN